MSTALSNAKSLHFVKQSLSEREAVYAELRASGAPAFVAAQAAGYADPADQALTLERDPRLRTAIELFVREAQHKLEITREDVLQGFMDATRMAASATELVMAWREVGKLINAYQPPELTINVRGADVKERVKKLSDFELARMAAIDADFVVLEDEDDEGRSEA